MKTLGTLILMGFSILGHSEEEEYFFTERETSFCEPLFNDNVTDYGAEKGAEEVNYLPRLSHLDAASELGQTLALNYQTLSDFTS